jgi:hypothetical protein
MDITYELQKVGIFFAYNRLVPILKEVATAFMSMVEVDSVPGHKSPHNLAERNRPGPQQRVEMVWDQRESVALGLGVFEDPCHPIEESLAVLIVLEDRPSFYAAGHHVLQ